MIQSPCEKAADGAKPEKCHNSSNQLPVAMPADENLSLFLSHLQKASLVIFHARNRKMKFSPFSIPQSRGHCLPV
jgi:hypothetical protein